MRTRKILTWSEIQERQKRRDRLADRLTVWWFAIIFIGVFVKIAFF